MWSFMVGVMFMFVLSPKLQAAELTIAFSVDTPPYAMEKANSGIEIEIVRAALKHKGHSFKVRQMSYRQLDDAVTEKGMDAAATVLKKDDGTYYSENYIIFKNYAITRKSSGIKIDRVAVLKGKSIVAWENAYKDLGPEFESLFSPTVELPYRKKYREIADQAKQVEMFWKKEAEVIVIDKSVMLWFTKQLGEKVGTPEELVYHKIFPEKTEFRIGFKNKQIRDDFNAGLKQIRENGVYQKIYDKYLK
jgi:polar amino acid transport system substrate-binding protein